MRAICSKQEVANIFAYSSSALFIISNICLVVQSWVQYIPFSQSCTLQHAADDDSCIYTAETSSDGKESKFSLIARTIVNNLTSHFTRFE